jgi:hypothetical protein
MDLVRVVRVHEGYNSNHLFKEPIERIISSEG